jgi:hypothetical protein
LWGVITYRTLYWALSSAAQYADELRLNQIECQFVLPDACHDRIRTEVKVQFPLVLQYRDNPRYENAPGIVYWHIIISVIGAVPIIGHDPEWKENWTDNNNFLKNGLRLSTWSFTYNEPRYRFFSSGKSGVITNNVLSRVSLLSLWIASWSILFTWLLWFY